MPVGAGFRGLPKPYIVLGSRRFVRWARARVVSEMKSQSPIYRRIAQALAVN